jgi:predicted nucleic acid-binding protein
MPADLVVDASVAAKMFFHEKGSDRARALLTSGTTFAAPDLLFLEVASIATKQVRRGLCAPELAREAVVSMVDVIDEVVPCRELRLRAFIFARDDGFSAYDGSYLALADRLGVPLVTADDKLVERARTVGVGRLVRSL